MKRKTVWRVYISCVKTNHFFFDKSIAHAYINGDKFATIKKGWIISHED